jgi:hypothetical protein
MTAFCPKSVPFRHFSAKLIKSFLRITYTFFSRDKYAEITEFLVKKHKLFDLILI